MKSDPRALGRAECLRPSQSARTRPAECLRQNWLNPGAMQNDITKRLMWGGLLAGIGALTSIVANRIATEIWQRVFKEDPPVD